MTMTHKEALAAAMDAFDDAIRDGKSEFEALAEEIRAYVEARGLALVPSGEWVTLESALEAIDHVEKYNGNGRAQQARRMLAAAPDPFKEEQA